jgi:hypothetical protein
MRFLLRLIGLGFAGLGVYRTWELVAPKLSEARDRATGARDEIEPAIRDASETLQTAVKDAAETLVDGAPDERIMPGTHGSGPERISPLPKLST